MKTDNSVFVIDADVFIEAKDRYYAFDIAPVFWDTLIAQVSQGRIRSIDRIKKQLEDGNDELTNWISRGNLNDAFCSSEQVDVIASYREIMEWVQNNTQFKSAARAAYANDPDAWLIAFAMAKHNVVVTQEEFVAQVQRRVPIPNVCRQFNIEYMDTFAMLRALGVKFD